MRWIFTGPSHLLHRISQCSLEGLLTWLGKPQKIEFWPKQWEVERQLSNHKGFQTYYAPPGTKDFPQIPPTFSYNQQFNQLKTHSRNYVSYEILHRFQHNEPLNDLVTCVLVAFFSITTLKLISICPAKKFHLYFNTSGSFCTSKAPCSMSYCALYKFRNHLSDFFLHL